LAFPEAVLWGRSQLKAVSGANADFAKNKKVSSTAKQVVEAHEEPVVALSETDGDSLPLGKTFCSPRYAGGEALCK